MQKIALYASRACAGRGCRSDRRLDAIDRNALGSPIGFDKARIDFLFFLAARHPLASAYTQWMSAAQRKDLPTLETILAPEFTYTDNKIGRQTRADWFATLAVYDVDQFSFQSIEVMPYGDVVVAIVVYEQTGQRYGEPRSGTFFITDVWHRAHGGWQVVARSSMLAQPA